MVFEVLSREIGFLDFEKVLNLAKMYITYWKSIEILNSTVCLLKLFFTVDASSAGILHCVPWAKFLENEAEC